MADFCYAIMPYSAAEVDSNLHRAINVLQAVVLRLEALKRLDLDETELTEELNRLIRYSVECANLLHEARKDTQIIPGV